MHLREADPVRLGPSGLPIISACDIAIGYPAGSVPLAPRPTAIESDPACALRNVLRPALLRTPCVVAFSGGRDSSLHNLVDPVALRDAWLADVPPASTAMLLQQAWLASQMEVP